MSEHSSAPSAIAEGTTGSKTNVLLAAALAYAAKGQPVFPCRSSGERAKAPLVEHWREEASTDPRMISIWWSWHPTAAIGLPTGQGCGLWSVLDIDNKTEGSGFPSAQRLRAAGLLRGAQWIVSTPSGGQHVYYPAGEHGNGSLRGHYIDHRGVGGYVLAPPSYIEGVGRYVRTEKCAPDAEVRPLDWEACKRLLAGPPLWVNPFRVGANVGALAEWVEGLQPGERNSGLYWAARRVIERGDDPSALVGAAVVAGLPHEEAMGVINSALNASGGRS